MQLERGAGRLEQQLRRDSAGHDLLPIQPLCASALPERITDEKLRNLERLFAAKQV